MFKLSINIILKFQQNVLYRLLKFIFIVLIVIIYFSFACNTISYIYFGLHFFPLIIEHKVIPTCIVPQRLPSTHQKHVVHEPNIAYGCVCFGFQMFNRFLQIWICFPVCQSSHHSLMLLPTYLQLISQSLQTLDWKALGQLESRLSLMQEIFFIPCYSSSHCSHISLD